MTSSSSGTKHVPCRGARPPGRTQPVHGVQAVRDPAPEPPGSGSLAAMSETVSRLRRAVIERVVEGPGEADRAARRAAFDGANVPAPAAALVDKIAHAASAIGDGDLAAVKAAGLAEDAIFELAVCAACGEATRQLEAGLAALDAALAAQEPR